MLRTINRGAFPMAYRSGEYRGRVISVVKYWRDADGTAALCIVRRLGAKDSQEWFDLEDIRLAVVI